MKTEILSPAKINIFLRVLGKDPDSGYHYLSMLMAPISIYDIMHIEESNKFSILLKNTVEQISLESNIVYKIYESTQNYTGKKLPEFNVTIDKQIPSGAGMGGGSSNGAFFLIFLNEYLSLGLNLNEMITISSRVGSDIPFFLYKSPAFVQGFGEKVSPVTIHNFFRYILVIFPDFSVNTALAYALFDKKYLTRTTEININVDRVSEFSSLNEWKNVICNDLQAPVFEKNTLLEEIQNRLYASGAEKAFMTGSGSTMIGLFSSKELFESAFNNFSTQYEFVRKVNLITA